MLTGNIFQHVAQLASGTATSSTSSASSIGSAVSSASVISEYVPSRLSLPSITTRRLCVMPSASSASVISEYVPSRLSLPSITTRRLCVMPSASSASVISEYVPSRLSSAPSITTRRLCVIPSSSSSSVASENAPSRLSSSHSSLPPQLPSTSSYASVLARSTAIPDRNPLFMKRTPGGKKYLMSYFDRKTNEDPLEFECPICLLDLTDDLVVADCGHIFHDFCLRDWHKSNGGAKCPSCTLEIKMLAVDVKSASDFKYKRYPFDSRPNPRDSTP